MITRRFQELETYTHEDVEDALERNDPEELHYVPVAVSLNDEDVEWAEALCLRLSRHPDATVRGNAVLGLGHIARRFGALSMPALAVIEEALRENDPHVRSQASAAKDDAEMFVERSRRRPV